MKLNFNWLGVYIYDIHTKDTKLNDTDCYNL